MAGYAVDKYGLTLPNKYLALFFPATNKAIVLYVRSRRNPAGTLINYGPLPTTTGNVFNVYNGLAGGTGGSASPGAAGQIPASSWLKGFQFSVPSTYYISGAYPFGNSDIWYTQITSRLFEVSQYVTPNWLRIGVDIPSGQVQQSIQDQVAGGVDQDFGWSRGKLFTVHVPNLHYGFGYGNDSNIAVYTRAIFRYAEQDVQLVTDPNLAFAIINQLLPNDTHWVMMPVSSNASAISGALVQTYGFDGLPVLPKAQQQKAVETYMKLFSANKMVQGAM